MASGVIGRPVGVDGDDTRRHILTVALECFASHGYSATTTRMIADRAGLTGAAVYHHFGKKKDLMLAVNRATQLETSQQMRAALTTADTFLGKVQALLDVVHDLARNKPELAVFASMAQDEARRHPELSEMADDRTIPDLFAELLDFGLSTGEVAPQDAVQLRGALTALIVGLAFLASDANIRLHAELTHGCKRLVEGSIVRQPGTAVDVPVAAGRRQPRQRVRKKAASA
jgi:AcrR family transcriptional regulator